MGVALLGYAMQKHGLGKRFAIGLLRIKGVGNTTYRLLFFYMLAAGILSSFISNVGVVAMMMPIGMSLVAYVRTLTGQTQVKPRGRLGSLVALGTLYAAMAGGMATVAGAPHNVVAAALLERLTGETIGWFRWMKISVPVFLLALVAFYFVLRIFFKPEIATIPGGQEFIRYEAKKLGPMSRGEKNVSLIFLAMMFLFTIPSLTPLVMGDQHPTAVWLRQTLTLWTVPPIVMVLLFVLPTDVKKWEFTLSWRETVTHSPWNIMLLCTSAVAMTDALGQFGLYEFMKNSVANTGISAFTLPLLAPAAAAAMTETTSGIVTIALFGNVFIPAAVQAGYNPASITIAMSNVAGGMMFPWSSAPAAIAFASGEIEMKDMIKVGLIADGCLVVIVSLMHIAFASNL
jgi:sodium-dependent dicarboxylate transporter 2/3/5